MKKLRKMLKALVRTLKDLHGLHPCAVDMMRGGLQFMLLLYLFAAAMSRAALLTPDYIRTMAYVRAALEVAPVMPAAGVVSGLVADLALRGKTTTGGGARHSEDKPSDSRSHDDTNEQKK